MSRCHATRKAVYRQHQNVAREFVNGWPWEFSILIRPGHSVTYGRHVEIDPWGDKTGNYEYRTGDAGWKTPLPADQQLRDLMSAVRAGNFSLFVLSESPDPYKLR